MTIVKCPNCQNENEIDIARAIDEEGEAFRCKHCGFPFRYATK